MGLFEKLFGSKKLTFTDADLGNLESLKIRGNKVDWQMKKKFFATEIKIFIGGTKEGIEENQKQLLLKALENETTIISEAAIALREEYANAEIDFESIAKHFDVSSISIYDQGFELAFQEKKDPYYYFNVHFVNNRQVGVSIDG